MSRVVDLKKVTVWRERLQRFSMSGLKVASFCRQECVSAASFYFWRKRLADECPSVGSATSRAKETFLPVRLTSTVGAAQVGRPIEIRLPNGVRVRLPGDNLAALRAGIEAAAEAASC